MRKFTILLLIAGVAIVVAALYGVGNDQVTYTISPEYYTRFKFIQFNLADSGAARHMTQPRSAVVMVGVEATWWMGLYVGLILGLVALVFRNADRMFQSAMQALGLVLLFTVASGFAGWLYGRDVLVKRGVNWRLPDNLMDKPAFITAGTIHNFSYAGAVIGLVAGIAFLLIKKYRIRKRAQAMLIGIFLCGHSYAQLPTLPILRDSIYSNILKEERTLEIVLPVDYGVLKASRTGVIYVTDGEWNTRIASDIQQFLGIQFIPPHIIVGIDHAPRGKGDMRYRDLTPTRLPNENGPEASGGGEAFLAFVTKEVMPYINQKYRNSGKNIFFGHSLGGLFGMYALLKEPKSFTGYLLADPSLWWQDRSLMQLARERLGTLTDTTRFVLITGRSGMPLYGMGIAEMDSILKQRASDKLHWKSAVYSDETHNSMVFRTLYDGLKYIYWGYYAGKNLGFHPDQGFVQRGKPINVHCFNDDFSDIYFTTDGTTPTEASTPLPWNGSIPVDGAATLCVKAFCNQPEFSKTDRGTFLQVSEPFRAVVLPKHMGPGGLHYAYYLLKDSGNLAHARPVASGRADSGFVLGKIDDPENYLCVFTGYVRAAAAGYYIFGTSSWGATKVYVGDQLVLDQPGRNGLDLKTSVFPLDSGYHVLRIEHVLKQAQQKMDLFFVNPEGVARDENPQRMPLEALYSAAKK